MDDGARRYQPGIMRASDADRDAVVAELSLHFQAGRLTLDEFDERSTRALHAKTLGELGDLTTDLPRAGRPARPPAPQMEPPGARPKLAAAFAAMLALVILLGSVLSTASGTGHGAVGLWWLALVAPLALLRLGGGGRRR